MKNVNFYDLIQVHFAKFFLNLTLILRNHNLMKQACSKVDHLQGMINSELSR